MTSSSDIVWDTITNSAKTKFDYTSFEEQFDDEEENLADNILFKTIIGFVNKKTNEVIALELYNDMMMIGFIWELEDIQEFIKDKEILLKSEIYACQIANSLLEDGKDPLMVLNAINQLLN